MYRLFKLRGLTLHQRKIPNSSLFCSHYTVMAGDQDATTSAGAAEVKLKDNTMREVKILMLHGKNQSDEGVAIGTFSHLRGALFEEDSPDDRDAICNGLWTSCRACRACPPRAHVSLIGFDLEHHVHIISQET